MTRFLPAFTTIFAGLALSLSLLQAGSAQAGIFDFDIKWNDNTTTKGWLEVDNSPESQWGDPSYYTYQYWNQTSLLDASFTHEGTSYDKSAVTSLDLSHYDFSTSYYQQYYGKAWNFLSLGFGNQYLYGGDYGADGSQPYYYSDYGYKYNTTNWSGYTGATSFSLVERSAKAVPEPATFAGLALVGAGLAASRRKHLRKTAV